MLLVLLVTMVLGSSQAKGRECKDCGATKAEDLFASTRHRVCRKCNTKKHKAQQTRKAANTAPKVRSKCSCCGVTQAAEYFSKDKSQPGGLSAYCKVCKSQVAHDFSQKYQAEMEAAESLTCTVCKQTKPVHEMRKTERSCLQCNSEYKAPYDRKRYATDENFRLSILLRVRILEALKGAAKSNRTMDLLGCTIPQFKQHIQKQFAPGMTWANQGQWHLDHIVACANWDLRDSAQQAKCFHFSNYQPLWGSDNLSKGAKKNWLPAAEPAYPSYSTSAPKPDPKAAGSTDPKAAGRVCPKKASAQRILTTSHTQIGISSFMQSKKPPATQHKQHHLHRGPPGSPLIDSTNIIDLCNSSNLKRARLV